jgi:hypothetical protein
MNRVNSVSKVSVAGLPADVQRLSRQIAEQFSLIQPGAELFLVGGIVRRSAPSSAICRSR